MHTRERKSEKKGKKKKKKKISGNLVNYCDSNRYRAWSPVPHCLTRALINERARDTKHGR